MPGNSLNALRPWQRDGDSFKLIDISPALRLAPLLIAKADDVLQISGSAFYQQIMLIYSLRRRCSRGYLPRSLIESKIFFNPPALR